MDEERILAYAMAAIAVMLAIGLLITLVCGAIVIVDATCEMVKGRACG